MAKLYVFTKKSLLGSLLLMALAGVGVSTSGCSSADGAGDGAASGNGGRTGSGGSGGSGGTYTPPTCGQTCQDYVVAHGVNHTAWFLWNQLVAGRPSGTKNTTGTCPLGGSVQITGTTGVSDNGINTADVVFALQGCSNSDAIYSLTFTGEVTMEGSFRSNSDFMAMTFTSPSLGASGALDVYDDPEIDETCEVTFAQNGTGESGTLVGRVCGRQFNSETAFDQPSGTGGSGGSGSAGTSGSGAGAASGSGGNDCRCYCPDDSDCTNATEPNPCGVDADGIPEVCGCPIGCP
jgi:hypothetical protein